MLPVTNAQLQQAVFHRPWVTVRRHQYVCVYFYEVNNNVVFGDCARSSVHLCVTSTHNFLMFLCRIQRSNRARTTFRESRLKDCRTSPKDLNAFLPVKW